GRRGIRTAGFDGALLAIGHVEEERRGDDAAPEDVEAAAIERVAMVLRILDLAEGRILPNVDRLIDLHRRAAELFDEQSGYGEGLVAEHPAWDAEARTAGE